MFAATLNTTLPFFDLWARKAEYAKPVWEHPAPAQPVRHPARPAIAYRPRGIYHEDLAEAWGFTRHQAQAQENELKRFAQLDAEFEAARRAVARRWIAACAAGIPVGFGVLYVGYGLVPVDLPEPANASTMTSAANLATPLTPSAVSSPEVIRFAPSLSTKAPTMPTPQITGQTAIQPRSAFPVEIARRGAASEPSRIAPVAVADESPVVVVTRTASGSEVSDTVAALAPPPVMTDQPVINIAELQMPAQSSRSVAELAAPSAAGAVPKVMAAAPVTLFDTFDAAPLAPRGPEQDRALRGLDNQVAAGSRSEPVVALPMPSGVIPTKPAIISQTLVFDLQTVAPLSSVAPPRTSEITLGAMTDAAWNVTTAPALARPVTEANPFVCRSCAPLAPSLDGIGIALFETEGLAPNDLNTLQERLLGMGAAQVQRTETGITVARSQVRFYRTQDAATAALLAATLGAVAVDVSWAAPQTVAASFDLLIAAQDGNPSKN